MSEEPYLLIQRRINTGSWTSVQNVLVGSIETDNNGSYRNIFRPVNFKVIDTHGASVGDTVEYRFLNNTATVLSSSANVIRQYFNNAPCTFILQEIP